MGFDAVRVLLPVRPNSQLELDRESLILGPRRRGLDLSHARRGVEYVIGLQDLDDAGKAEHDVVAS